ncbi:MAG: hypothetical protein RR322_03535 [Oscillospiraceae bacterium]
MKNNLIERYIYAVTKRLSNSVKEDVAMELSSLIEDMLNERCGEVIPSEKDIYIVLTELGKPEELYEKYNSNSKNCLIGEPYYTTYKFILKIVLICVAFGMTLSSIIVMFMSADIIWYESVLSWVSMIFSGLISGFAFVTFIFAVFYQKNIDIKSNFDLNDLPDIPIKKKILSKKESTFSIIFIVLFFVIFNIAPQIFGAILKNPTRIIPIFNTEFIRNTWYLLFAFAGAGIIRECIKLLEGEYNKKVMITTIMTNVIASISAIIWLASDRIMNTEFVSEISNIFSYETKLITNIFANFNLFFLTVILFALILDTVETIIKSK